MAERDIQVKDILTDSKLYEDLQPDEADLDKNYFSLTDEEKNLMADIWDDEDEGDLGEVDIITARNMVEQKMEQYLRNHS